jgi:hypothetical protein
MKDRNFNNSPDEPRLDENDPVWRLLAESPRPEPDAWFAVRTVARCRNAGLGADWFAFRGILRWALGGGLVVCLAVLLLVPRTHHESAVPDQKKNVQEAFEIMASMDASSPDSTSTSSSTSTWQDSSL